MYLGRVAGRCSSADHRVPLGTASQEALWRAQARYTCGSVFP